jgi:hypothetical protein
LKTKHIFSSVASIAIALAIAIAWSSSRAGAFTLIERFQLNFGMVGITRGQVLRLNVTHLEGTGDSAPGPIQVELNFADSDGNALLPAVQITLTPGHSTFLDFAGNEIREGGRMEIRPVVKVLDRRAGRKNGLPDVAATVEAVDVFNGQTLFVYPGTLGSINVGVKE